MKQWFRRRLEWFKDEWCWRIGRPRHVVDLSWPMTEMFVVERHVPPSREVVLWCAEHAPDRHRVIFRTSMRDPGSMISYSRLAFRREADMVLFRLRWSEELAKGHAIVPRSSRKVRI